MGGALGHQRVEEFWRDTAARLNSMGDGASKDSKAWKTYWHELKYRTRKRDTDLKQHARGTGGGPAKKPLSDIERRILTILGEVSYAGNPEVQIPLNLPQAAQTTPPEPAVQNPTADLAHGLLEHDYIDQEPAQYLSDDNIIQEPEVQIPSPTDSAHHPQNAAPATEQVSPPHSPLAGSSNDSVIVGPRRGRQVRNTRPYRRRRYSDPPEWARRYEEERLRIDRARARSLDRLVQIAEQMLELFRRSQQH